MSKSTSTTKRTGRPRRSVAPPVRAQTETPVADGSRAFADGQRVRVRIRDVARFSGDSGEQMNGKAGTIERYSAASCNGDPPLGPAYLVRFDEPIPGWWADQSPVEAFWFPPGDLEAT